MHILSVGTTIEYPALNIENIHLSQLSNIENIALFDYIIISGGDGSIRRVIQTLHTTAHKAKFIINPTGSFNVIAKLHKVPKLDNVLNALAKETPLNHHAVPYYTLNDHTFLFSAGNMGDLQHIFLSETFRFGILKRGITKYILAALSLFPAHLIMTPFMLLSPRRFFIFTPLRFIKKFGSFYGEVKEMSIDLDNEYNYIELDGDVVNIQESVLKIEPAGHINLIIS